MKTKARRDAKKDRQNTMADRIAEYVNSPRITHRLKIGRIISCRIQGNYGDYRTQIDMKDNKKITCTCPSDYWPCKHAFALAKTYEIAPETFVDFNDVIKNLKKKTKTGLLNIIRNMILRSSESLAALGIKGFEEETREEAEEDETVDKFD
ncbi:hypothetical protein COY52_04225 [Candidatus Desantisbacteria bacterium CG_4_10_14_0_8_um_filter_48_22]|uniref:SWIM-type domain-containing protein n=1 Tax=Candidatus Desantisbacteria bacterium CG_4_10_14_0_8_um_filter_48_22 TaxID=1974543 RepID=A0A2M7SDG3_9BACT|nr:MAG: hypothetical protein AUJ67_00650 [Candidatus Desantisbacteria bacterium CG1_02_49_89]PIV56172.1 MAG: hypothetical protein COS16_04685 [Candidatus Desantisbacteria bacterium CG02_land_8_20_14_3_00_49_13]PIZ17529.1 MAG: hypothetical protein COY52_04225 [Candidatus Desantisbacteria bacterium CG_4_10_14_0_8_um_filter_48_22]